MAVGSYRTSKNTFTTVTLWSPHTTAICLWKELATICRTVVTLAHYSSYSLTLKSLTSFKDLRNFASSTASSPYQSQDRSSLMPAQYAPVCSNADSSSPIHHWNCHHLAHGSASLSILPLHFFLYRSHPSELPLTPKVPTVNHKTCTSV